MTQERYMYKRLTFAYWTGLAALVLLAVSCSKNLPKERENVGDNSRFTTTVFQPVLGRTTFFQDNFFKGTTTFPATFKIVNPRRWNGLPAPELTDIFPVKVWKAAYDGNEKSVAEIEAKREIQYRPLFDIGEHSGTVTMWSESRAALIKPQPDSGYRFDVELSNSGGRKYFRDLKLQPFYERPFEPSNRDAITGQPVSNGVFPSGIRIKGTTKGRYLGPFDIQVYIRKVDRPGLSGNTLTFRFLDTLFNPIDPARFATTDWAHLVHGFNMRKTATEVTYDVAYPLPAITLPTRYTNTNGDRASVWFTFDRLGFGGFADNGLLALDFAIYEPGNWEIVFAFITDNPKFDND
ncbi:DUF5007 domain-containing protein [Niabella drilacis]|uniref:DUF5007 domain-containing protein n=1 Tax=Niabella drilacis (strain DSM 25811 / CCM 8410 / CCUG 62505 / LMG 26954 / E90) TaxID=1285928 RepID=A0A1G7B4A6_NIADE|nr:DUF5007 domain-containing protein [Niabella drilacis]SDE21782.1 protein of unknown function [Niabella drilacis]